MEAWNRDLTRRRFLCIPAACLQASPRISRELFLPSPAKDVMVVACACYTKASGGDMLSIEQRLSRSDTVDGAYYRHSRDYGRTWTAGEARKTGEKRPQGMLRRHPRACFADPSRC